MLRSNLDSEIQRFNGQQTEPPVKPIIVHHPVDPVLQTGASALLGGAMSIHAPWSSNNMVLLPVFQYYRQTDSKTRHGDRMCFSSTVAMAIKYLRPDALKGVNADDDYLKTVLKYGDTISATAHMRACQDYGIRASFYQNGSQQSLIKEIKSGYPVATGFLHKGHFTKPYGGGHWALLIGESSAHGIFHDPYGELDNVNGGYPRPGVGGREVVYSWQRWLPRWTVKGTSDGWYMTFRLAT